MAVAKGILGHQKFISLHLLVVGLQYEASECDLDARAGFGGDLGDTGQVASVAVRPAGAAHRDLRSRPVQVQRPVTVGRVGVVCRAEWWFG